MISPRWVSTRDKRMTGQTITKRTLDAWLSAHRGAERRLWDDKVLGFGVGQKPSGVASFILQYRTEDGASRRMTLGRVTELTPDEARKAAEQHKAKVRLGGDPLADKRRARGGETVSELCDAYIAASEARIASSSMKASTLRMDRSRIEAHVRPLLGSKRVQALTEADIRKFIADVASGATARADEGPRRGGTVRGGPGVAARTAGMLKTMLEMARQEEKIATNPAAKIKRPKEQKKAKALTTDEITRLGLVIRSMRGQADPVPLAAIRFLLQSGFRRMEGLGLQRAWIDLAGACAHLPDTKTGPQARALGVSALETIDALPLRGSYVFPSCRNDGHFVGLPKILTQLCHAAGIAGSVSPHSLRHTFASQAAALGYSELTLAGLLGHRLGSVTSRYARVPDASLRAAADAVSAHITKLLDGAAGADIVSIEAHRRDHAA
jgi:integrase